MDNICDRKRGGTRIIVLGIFILMNSEKKQKRDLKNVSFLYCEKGANWIGGNSLSLAEKGREKCILFWAFLRELFRAKNEGGIDRKRTETEKVVGHPPR